MVLTPDHRGTVNSSDNDDLPFSDESMSIDKSNLVDTVASGSQSDQENGLVNGDSHHRGVKDSSNYDDLQFIGESSSIDESNLENTLRDS